MAKDFFPDAEMDQLFWSKNLIAALGPDPTQWEITPEALADFVALRERFDAALSAARAGDRSRPDVLRKNDLKREHEDASRGLARVLAARPGITRAQRGRFGLLVASDETAAAAAARAPEVLLEPKPGRRVDVRLRASHGEAGGFWRSRPAGAVGALLFYRVADAPADREDGWTFYALTAKSRVAMLLPFDAPAGARVWVRACWIGRKGLACGAMSEPIATRLLDGMGASPVRIAA